MPTEDRPEISVVVVTVEPEDEIDSLQALESGSYDDYETIIRRDEGICRARNEGIKAANAEKIVFLDDDSIPVDGYLDLAAELLSTHPIVTGRITPPRDDWVNNLASHYDQGSEPKPTDRITGCNMAMRKEVFDEIGLFDENIQWGHDETEWMNRAQDAGYDAFYHPDLRVVHSFASGIIDYYEKQWDFGKADVYYRTRGENIFSWYVRDLFNINRYYNPDPSVMIGTATGQMLRNVSRLAQIVQYH
jgi:GT2 family glycosyltransferase